MSDLNCDPVEGDDELIVALMDDLSIRSLRDNAHYHRDDALDEDDLDGLHRMGRRLYQFDVLDHFLMILSVIWSGEMMILTTITQTPKMRPTRTTSRMRCFLSDVFVESTTDNEEGGVSPTEFIIRYFLFSSWCFLLLMCVRYMTHSYPTGRKCENQFSAMLIRNLGINNSLRRKLIRIIVGHVCTSKNTNNCGTE